MSEDPHCAQGASAHARLVSGKANLPAQHFMSRKGMRTCISACSARC